MTQIKQPHDAYAHFSLSQPEVAKRLLKQYLPQKIVKLIDFDSLQITKETFIEPDLNF